MRLWHANDPYGIAVVRRVLLWFALAVVIIGSFRVLTKGEELLPFVASGLLITLIGLMLEPLTAWLVRRRIARRHGRDRPDRPSSDDVRV